MPWGEDTTAYNCIEADVVPSIISIGVKTNAFKDCTEDCLQILIEQLMKSKDTDIDEWWPQHITLTLPLDLKADWPDLVRDILLRCVNFYKKKVSGRSRRPVLAVKPTNLTADLKNVRKRDELDNTNPKRCRIDPKSTFSPVVKLVDILKHENSEWNFSPQKSPTKRKQLITARRHSSSSKEDKKITEEDDTSDEELVWPDIQLPEEKYDYSPPSKDSFLNFFGLIDKDTPIPARPTHVLTRQQRYNLKIPFSSDYGRMCIQDGTISRYIEKRCGDRSDRYLRDQNNSIFNKDEFEVVYNPKKGVRETHCYSFPKRQYHQGRSIEKLLPFCKPVSVKLTDMFACRVVLTKEDFKQYSECVNVEEVNSEQGAITITEDTTLRT